MKLNEEQTLAVQHPFDQAACLIAGAGSGKTRVMTERVRHILQSGVEPRRICAITFTNKAAGELIHRLDIDSHNVLEVPRVSTIHSLALNGIRKNPRAFGLQESITPLDEWDQRQMLQKILDSHEFTEMKVAKLLDKISYHRARGIGFCSEYTEDVHEQACKNHAGYHALDEQELELWSEFEVTKTKNSVVDFDDMLHLFNRRARQDAAWREKLQTQFSHVLVDEAQDLSAVQWEFVNHLLSPTNSNLFVVGDISQSIMGFNGSAPHMLIDYSKNWRGSAPKLYRIARNHRSVPEIVNFANLIQSKMKATIPLTMESWRGTENEHGQVVRLDKDLPQSIAVAIAMEIQKDASRKREPIPYKDNAILVRSGKTQVRDLEVELIRRRIPYVIRGGRALLQTEEIRDLMAYLRLAANPKDFIALSRASGAPRIGVGEAGLEKIRVQANEAFDGNLLEAAKGVKKGNLSGFVNIIEHVQMFKEAPITAVEKALLMSNYRVYVQEKYRKEPGRVQAKMENLDRFQLMVMLLVKEEESLTLDDLIFQLSLDRAKAGDIEEEKRVLEYALTMGKISQEEYDAKLQTIEQGSVVVSTIHCSPPDEPILTSNGIKPLGSLDPEVDKIYSYIPKCNQLVRGPNNRKTGYNFSLKTRWYKGDLVVIETKQSRTRVTPEHRVRVAFHESFYNKWVVYLMRRGDWWRIGTCASIHKPYHSGGIKGRLATEKADCAWILGVFETKEEALAAEIKYQIIYGIPSICFEKWNYKIVNPKLNTTRLHEIHNELCPVIYPRAVQLLNDKGLLPDSPLFCRAKSRWYMHAKWFDTVAANMLDGYMVVPTASQLTFDTSAPARPTPIQAKVSREFYEGQVFSLDVPPHSYYVSGGIVVHNSAKGLEWRRVYVTNVYETSLPHMWSMGSEEEIEEERRLFYVAATRARDSLVICVPQKVQREANTMRVQPSRFLAEIGV